METKVEFSTIVFANPMLATYLQKFNRYGNLCWCNDFDSCGDWNRQIWYKRL